MRNHRSVLRGCMFLTLLIASTGAFHAAIVCQFPLDLQNEECRFLLIAGITEEPDPLAAIGSPGATSPVIPLGDAAQVATGQGMTVAVWAAGVPGNRDIYFSEWRPTGWFQQTLTSGGTDETGPTVAIAGDGAIFVAWWETQEPRRVRVARRDPGTLRWGQPVAFSGMQGSRPSVVVRAGGEVMVAFERRFWTGGHEVVIRRVPPGGGPVEEVLARTTREAPLVVQLHMYGSLAYIDWVHREGFFGYSEFRNGRWSASMTSRPLTQRAGSFYVEVEPLPSP